MANSWCFLGREPVKICFYNDRCTWQAWDNKWKRKKDLVRSDNSSFMGNCLCLHGVARTWKILKEVNRWKVPVRKEPAKIFASRCRRPRAGMGGKARYGRATIKINSYYQWRSIQFSAESVKRRDGYTLLYISYSLDQGQSASIRAKQWVEWMSNCGRVKVKNRSD